MEQPLSYGLETRPPQLSLLVFNVYLDYVHMPDMVSLMTSSTIVIPDRCGPDNRNHPSIMSHHRYKYYTGSVALCTQSVGDATKM